MQLGYDEYESAFDAALVNIISYSANFIVASNPLSYSADAILTVDPNDPRINDSFINVFLWAAGNEWNKALNAIELTSLRLKLDYASSNDLDEFWGVFLDLKRRANEEDEHYRTRLATYIRIVTSNGTKSNCETIIDRITGVRGGVTLLNFYPATVYLKWNNPEAIINAEANHDILEESLDMMFAAGVDWSVYYPVKSYQADWKRIYEEVLSYNADGAISIIKGKNYYARASMWEETAKTYYIGSYLYSSDYVSYRIAIRILEDILVGYQADSYVVNVSEFTHYVNYSIACYNSKVMKRGYRASGTLEAI